MDDLTFLILVAGACGGALLLFIVSCIVICKSDSCCCKKKRKKKRRGKGEGDAFLGSDEGSSEDESDGAEEGTYYFIDYEQGGTECGVEDGGGGGDQIVKEEIFDVDKIEGVESDSDIIAEKVQIYLEDKESSRSSSVDVDAIVDVDVDANVDLNVDGNADAILVVEIAEPEKPDLIVLEAETNKPEDVLIDLSEAVETEVLNLEAAIETPAAEISIEIPVSAEKAVVDIDVETETVVEAQIDTSLVIEDTTTLNVEIAAETPGEAVIEISPAIESADLSLELVTETPTIDVSGMDDTAVVNIEVAAESPEVPQIDTSATIEGTPILNLEIVAETPEVAEIDTTGTFKEISLEVAAETTDEASIEISGTIDTTVPNIVIALETPEETLIEETVTCDVNAEADQPEISSEIEEVTISADIAVESPPPIEEEGSSSGALLDPLASISDHPRASLGSILSNTSNASLYSSDASLSASNPDLRAGGKVKPKKRSSILSRRKSKTFNPDFSLNSSLKITLQFIESVKCLKGTIVAVTGLNTEIENTPDELSFHLRFIPSKKFHIMTKFKPSWRDENLDLSFTMGPVVRQDLCDNTLRIKLYGKKYARLSRATCFGECSFDLTKILDQSHATELEEEVFTRNPDGTYSSDSDGLAD